MKDRLVMFITDAGFLVPTMSAVLQVCAQPRVTAQADIMIFLIDIPDATIQDLRAAFANSVLTFVPIPSTSYALPHGVVFNETGVPLATLARFAVGALIPDRYEHIIYLDGDIQICGDIAPLVEHSVAPGHIAAANDAMWLARGDRGRFWSMSKQYIAALGLRDPADYFNAGVLLFRRQSWIEISAAAKRFFLENSRKCLFHDQSALNAVCNGRRETISPAYNFISNYAEVGVQRNFEPRIIHFTGPRKPWFFAGAPWHGRFLASYDALIARYAVLAPYARRPSEGAIAKLAAARRRQDLLMRLRTPWRSALRRMRFRRYVRDTAFAVG